MSQYQVGHGSKQSLRIEIFIRNCAEIVVRNNFQFCPVQILNYVSDFDGLNLISIGTDMSRCSGEVVIVVVVCGRAHC